MSESTPHALKSYEAEYGDADKMPVIRELVLASLVHEMMKRSPLRITRAAAREIMRHKRAYKSNPPPHGSRKHLLMAERVNILRAIVRDLDGVQR